MPRNITVHFLTGDRQSKPVDLPEGSSLGVAKKQAGIAADTLLHVVRSKKSGATPNDFTLEDGDIIYSYGRAY